MENSNLIKSYQLGKLDKTHIKDFFKTNRITNEEYIIVKKIDMQINDATEEKKKYIITYDEKFFYSFELSNQDKTQIVDGIMFEKSEIESVKISDKNLDIYFKNGEKIFFIVGTLRYDIYSFCEKLFSKNVIKRNEIISKFNGIREINNDERKKYIEYCKKNYLNNSGCFFLLIIAFIMFSSYMVIKYNQSMDEKLKIIIFMYFIILYILFIFTIRGFFIHKKKTKEMENQKIYIVDVYGYYCYETTSGPDDTKDWAIKITDGYFFLNEKFFISKEAFLKDKIEGKLIAFENNNDYILRFLDEVELKKIW